ncbi:MAG TPA: hypothetical protein PLO68_16740, partial [Sedimentisphaerales bacterium]|nr:hypothetical protein [Sedimentisphaerales bacterium]
MGRRTAFLGSWLILGVVFVTSVTWPSACRAASKPITLETLLEEMVDRDTIARLPDPARRFRGQQTSGTQAPPAKLRAGLRLQPRAGLDQIPDPGFPGSVRKITGAIAATEKID